LSLPQALCFTNQTFSSPNVRKIAYVIRKDDFETGDRILDRFPILCHEDQVDIKAIHAQEDRAAARQKAEQVASKLREMKLADAAAIVVAGIEETLYYYAFPSEHWRCLRTNNPLERLLREVRRRPQAVGAFPDGKSAQMLAAARLRHVARSKWGHAGTWI